MLNRLKGADALVFGVRARLSLGLQRRQSREKRDFDRIYHLHIRKTAGTSLNAAFLAADEKVQVARLRQLGVANIHARFFDGRPVVGWNKNLINRGSFFFAFSHIPYTKLSLPERTFTFCVVRDPLERLLSYYRMLDDYTNKGVYRFTGRVNPALEREAAVAAHGFHNFLESCDRRHLCTHLYMLSSGYDISDAVENAGRLTAIYRPSSLDLLADDIKDATGLSLNIGKLNAGQSQFRVNAKDVAYAKTLLAPEYALLERVYQLENFRS